MYESVFAKVIQAIKLQIKPGHFVTAITSISSIFFQEFFKALLKTEFKKST